MVGRFRGSFELEGISKFRMLIKRSVRDGPQDQDGARKKPRKRPKDWENKERRSGS